MGILLHDWGLVINNGVLGVAEKVLKTDNFGVVLTHQLDVLTMLKVRHKMFYPVLRGGANFSGPTIFPCCSPPPSPKVLTGPLNH